MSLIQHFDRIAVISLPQRTDRRARLKANLQQRGLATEADLTWVEAVDGRQERLPDWWEMGPGAWGCRASQLAVIEAAQRDGLETVLILEDDAYFHPRAAQWLSWIMPLVPDDWDFLFLGGQHMHDPVATAHPRLLRGTGISRTHAYAVHRRAFASVIAQVSDLRQYQENPGWHIDHQFVHGQQQGIWRSYAPAWWLAAQEEGHSDIGAGSYGRRWWPAGNHFWQLPFVETPGQLLEQEQENEWVYRAQPQEKIPQDNISRAIWLRDVAREAWLQGRLPACPLGGEEISRLWPGGYRTLQSLAELSQLADYPANQLFPHAFANK